MALDAFGSGRSRARVSRALSNWGPLHKRLLLTRRGFVLASLDKEPGVVLVRRADLASMHAAVLSKDCYLKMEGDGGEGVPRLRREFLDIANKVARCGGVLDQDMCRSLMHFKGSWCFNRLQILRKSLQESQAGGCADLTKPALL